MITQIKPELIAEGKPQVIDVSLAPFNKAKEQVTLTVAELNKYLTITSREALADAMEVLKIASKVEKAIEGKRKELVEPFNDGAKAINAHAKSITEGLPGAIAGVKSAALRFQKEEEERAALLVRKARIEQLTDMGLVWDGKVAAFIYGAVWVTNTALNSTQNEWERTISRTSLDLSTQEQEAQQALKEEDEDLYDLLGYEGATIEPVAVLPAPAAAYFEPPKLAGAAKVWKFEVVNPLAVPAMYSIVDETAIRRAIANGERDIPGVRIYQEDQLRVR